MEKEFIPSDLTLRLKALGFDEPCFGWYQDNTLRFDVNANQSIKFHEHLGRFKGCFIAPTFSQCFRWFRKKYHIIGYPIFKGGKTTQTAWYDYVIYSEIEWEVDNPNQQWKTYEEAELACLDKLIEIVESKSE